MPATAMLKPEARNSRFPTQVAGVCHFCHYLLPSAVQKDARMKEWSLTYQHWDMGCRCPNGIFMAISTIFLYSYFWKSPQILSISESIEPGLPPWICSGNIILSRWPWQLKTSQIPSLLSTPVPLSKTRPPNHLPPSQRLLPLPGLLACVAIPPIYFPNCSREEFPLNPKI